jgi:hypothetical protein
LIFTRHSGGLLSHTLVMLNQKRIAVVMPAYNAAKTLDRPPGLFPPVGVSYLT